MPKIAHAEVSFSVPADWTDATQVVALGRFADGFAPNATVVSDPKAKDETLEVFAQKQLHGLQQSLGGFEPRSEGPAKHGTLAGVEREYQFQAQGRRLVQRQFSFAAGERIYTVTFTDLAERFEASRPVIQQLFDSVAIAQTRG